MPRAFAERDGQQQVKREHHDKDGTGKIVEAVKGPANHSRDRPRIGQADLREGQREVKAAHDCNAPT
jgi:hypothetical protein